jgi:hypothetical protein
MTHARRPASRWMLMIGLVAVVGSGAPPTFAGVVPAERYSVLLDLDLDPTTGCAVATVDGPFDGVERILTTLVTADQVTAVESLDCQPASGVFDAPVAVGGLPIPWPVGLGAGTAGADVVETYLALAPPSPRALRLAFLSEDPAGGGDAILGAAGSPLVLVVDPGADIPTAAPTALLVLALLLVLAAVVLLRGGGPVAGVGLLLLAGGLVAVGAEAVGTIVLDGDPADWEGTADLTAPDPAGDAPPGADLRLGLAAVDPSRTGVWLRFDAARNRPPAISTDGSVSIPENQLAVLDVEASDPEGETEGAGLTYSLSGGADLPLFDIDGGTGELSFQAAPDFEGPTDAGSDNVYQVEVTVADSGGRTDQRLFSIEVTDQNEPPIATDASFAIDENSANGTVVGVVAASDPDQSAPWSTLEFSITSGNAGNVFAIDATGTIRVETPAGLDFETTAVFDLVVTVTDGGVPPLSDTAAVTIDLNDVAELTWTAPEPICSFDNVSCSAAIGVEFNLNGACNTNGWSIAVDYDEDGDGVAIEDISARVTGTGPLFTITGSYPIGNHRFDVRAQDDCGTQLSTSIPFSVIDCKAPAPICINGLAVDLQAGASTVFATDFIASPVTDCSPPVTYSINRSGSTAAVSQTSLALTCADLGTLLVEVHGWDGVGLDDFCETFVLVQDNLSSCPPP